MTAGRGIGILAPGRILFTESPQHLDPVFAPATHRRNQWLRRSPDSQFWQRSPREARRLSWSFVFSGAPTGAFGIDRSRALMRSSLARGLSRPILILVLLCPRSALGQVVSPDTPDYALATRLLLRGDTLARLPDRDHALQALALWKEALSIYEAGNQRFESASTLSSVTRVYSALGMLDSAFIYYGRSIPHWRALGDRSREASMLNNMGLAQSHLGRQDSALAYYARALPITRMNGDQPIEAATLNSIGASQGLLGRPDSALVYYAQSLSIVRALRNREREAIALNNIGSTYADLDRPDSALVYYSLALPIQRDVDGRLRALGTYSSEATTLNNIGLVQAKLGRPDSALAYFSWALPIQREVRDRSGEATTLNNIGLVQAKLGRPDSALAYYSQALPIRREVGDRAGEAHTLGSIGHILLRSTDESTLRSSAARFDSSAALFARMRRSTGGDANAVSFSEGGGYIFAGWSRAWQQLATQQRGIGKSSATTQAVAASLAAAERGRAQALRDLLDRRSGARVSDLDASDTIAGADLPAEAAQLLAPLRSSRTALLYYLTDGDTLRTWFLNPSGILEVLPPLAQPKGELAQQIATARGVLGADAAAARQRRGDPPMAQPNSVSRDGLSGSAGDPSAAVAALQALSAGVLPAGLDALLAPGTELVIIPHGTLGQVPFAALTLPGDTIPLGVRNPLRYSPSLRAIVAAEETGETTPRTGGGKARGLAIVVGNPEMPEVRDETGASHRLSALPGAAEEGRWVAAKLGTRVLTGSAASESVVRSSLSNAWVVHLATHGLAYGTEARVRDSYVALAPGAGQDGLLTLGELIDDDSLRLTADLIVLSACQTGLGEAREAEGTVGLQRGLLAKGARSVLVSLWSVDDAATRLLMERFYTHWLSDDGRPTLSKAEALRLAQGDVRAETRFANPRYWAAFQLVGAR